MFLLPLKDLFEAGVAGGRRGRGVSREGRRGWGWQWGDPLCAWALTSSSCPPHLMPSPAEVPLLTGQDTCRGPGSCVAAQLVSSELSVRSTAQGSEV